LENHKPFGGRDSQAGGIENGANLAQKEPWDKGSNLCPRVPEGPGIVKVQQRRGIVKLEDPDIRRAMFSKEGDAEEDPHSFNGTSRCKGKQTIRRCFTQGQKRRERTRDRGKTRE